MKKLIHNEMRLLFSTPAGLIDRLNLIPLDKGFIDWVVDNGYKLIFTYDGFPKFGDANFVKKEIRINGNIDQKEKDLTLVHELIHIAVPSPKLSRGAFNYKVYDDAIDKIAAQYVQNNEFMDYIKSKIPAYEEK